MRAPGIAAALLVVAAAALDLFGQDTRADPPAALPLPADTLDGRALLTVPGGLPREVPEPEDNRFSAARLALGRRLFFDPLLSADRKVSCATCHRPDHGFASPERFPTGAHGRRGERSAPTLFNRAFGASQMWDGRFATLEEQVLAPIEAENEMALTVPEALARLAAHPEYPALFGAAFAGREAGPPRADELARALAAFVRRLFLGDSPVDRFREGRFSALSPEERGGLWVFESKGGCWRCHAGDNFTDEEFHNTGVGASEGRAEPGREAVTGRDGDRGRFKTPTLRGLAFTAPYMHDGSLATLEEVVEFYRNGGGPNPHLDPELVPLELSDREAELLVAFLRALSRTAPR